ncbi:MAG: molybdopterin molybdotransferase MoeA [Bacteroidetes bacterium]|nr:molybdopterin molybdotransferase MoeA [Bacteroidota bacterium]
MVTVSEAEKIILSRTRDFGTEIITFQNCIGRVLAENIIADRDFPPFNRVTMDGIAINYNAFKNGARSFQIKATQSAGEPPIDINNNTECIEIMTGAVLPVTTDVVIPYEDIEIKNRVATIIVEAITPNQNIHLQGKDKKQKDILVEANQYITSAILSVAATVGKNKILVKKNPRIIIISTGDELVDIEKIPDSFQIRRSNDHTLLSILKEYSIDADMVHLPDDENIIFKKLNECLDQYDVILLSGGVSMGKFDFVPAALEKLSVEKLFHKVRQKPGKPFWFGEHGKGTLVFAFPGNPVSTFMCFHRYFLPWLKASQQIKSQSAFAILNEDFIFKPSLQYFLQVKLLINEKGQLIAYPVEGGGSGDLANLPYSDAFLELPLERTEFKKGEVFRIWPFKQFI